MCTVTWTFDAADGPAGSPSGFELYFNRDERLDRPPALPPRAFPPGSGEGLPYLAAVDPLGGGSWLAVNTAGLCVALLNRYDGSTATLPAHPDRLLSRGQLVRQIAPQPDIAAAEETLRHLVGAARFQAFSLLLLNPSEAGAEAAFAWDGRRLQRRELAGRLPFCSSSAFDTEAVVEGRQAQFASLLGAAAMPDADNSPTGAHLAAFHASHLPRRGPGSVCMHRPEAQTVSFSRVLVRPDAVGYGYSAGPPCSAPAHPPLWLPRAA